jgi:hypothetical protein
MNYLVVPSSLEIAYMVLFLFITILMYRRAMPFSGKKIQGDVIYSWTLGYAERISLQTMNILLLLVVLISSTISRMHAVYLILFTVIPLTPLLVPIKFTMTKLGIGQNGKGFVRWTSLAGFSIRGNKILLYQVNSRKSIQLVYSSSQKQNILSYLNRYIKKKKRYGTR